MLGLRIGPATSVIRRVPAACHQQVQADVPRVNCHMRQAQTHEGIFSIMQAAVVRVCIQSILLACLFCMSSWPLTKSHGSACVQPPVLIHVVSMFMLRQPDQLRASLSFRLHVEPPHQQQEDSLTTSMLVLDILHDGHCWWAVHYPVLWISLTP